MEPEEVQDILPLIAHLTSSEASPSNLENEDGHDTDVELAIEAIKSDLKTESAFISSDMESDTHTEKVSGTSNATWGEYIVNKVSKWFSNKETTGVQQNRSDSFPKSNDIAPPPTIDQHFLTTSHSRTELP